MTDLFFFTVNLGQKLLEALFEHWPRAHWFVENEGKFIKNEGKPLTNQAVVFFHRRLNRLCS